MAENKRTNNELVDLTVRVNVPEVDPDMVAALRQLVLDVFDPYPDATIDVTMRAPRVPMRRP